MKFKGVIIEESLKDKSVLKDIKILKTRVEEVTPEYKTPWFKQWTLHTVEISENKADEIANKISKSIDTSHNNWYSDFRNKNLHYIIFKNKIFKVSRSNLDELDEYEEVKKYGVSLGIPEYQLTFSFDEIED